MNAKTPVQGHKFQPPIHLEIDPNEDLGIDSPRREDVWERLEGCVKENRGKFLTLLAAAGLLAGVSLNHAGKETVIADAAAFAHNSYNNIDLLQLFEKSPAELREIVKRGGKSSARYYACCNVLGELPLLSAQERQALLAKNPWLQPYAAKWVSGEPLIKSQQ